MTTQSKPKAKTKSTPKAKTKSTPKARQKKTKIMFVCTGNTCRSPMAEKIMKRFLKDRGVAQNFSVSSCGLSVFVGSPMSENAVKALRYNGIRVSSHKAKQFNEKMIKSNDLIVCMSARHKLSVGEYDNVVTLGEIIGSNQDVLDPYGQDEKVYRKVCECFMYSAEEIYNYILAKKLV